VVTTVSPYLKTTTEKIAGRSVDVIYNGFDPADFEFEMNPVSSSFVLSHFGAFNRDRNPSALWKALGGLKKENPEFGRSLRIQLIGQTDGHILEEIETEGLKENLMLTDHMKHREGLRQISGSTLLLLPLNDAPNVRGILPGKMYEYIALRRPILAIGPADGDFADIIRKTQSGYVHDFHDVDGIRSTLLKAYVEFRENKLSVSPVAFEMFSRRNLTREIIGLAFR
jgi:hypothetical protein